MNRKPKILIFIDWYLPGFKAGGPIQSCANLVAHLKESAEFYIVTRDRDYCSEVAYNNIDADKWNGQNGIYIFYASPNQLRFQFIREKIKDVDPDIVYINGIFSPYFSIYPLILAKKLRVPSIIVAARGMLAKSALDVKWLKKSLLLMTAKKLGLYNKVVFQATNNKEEKDINALFGYGQEIRVAPNLPHPKLLSSFNTIIKESYKLKLVSVARIAPEKNTKYALEILASYKGSGIITFDLYGPIYNLDYWAECETIIKKLPSNVIVNYNGSIKSHIVPAILSESHIMFMPSRGENFGHIILESFAAGRPVLISDQTPWRALNKLGIGYDLPLTAKNDFLTALEKLVNLNQEEYNILCSNAFAYAKEYYIDAENIKANKALFNL